MALIAILAVIVIVNVRHLDPLPQDTHTGLFKDTVHDPCLQPGITCDRTYGCNEAILECDRP